ncbi:hypothetical protein NX059_012102 [Plenodomus lindquistii]|nr:hypothetical protein NX059_012102 [Plenodomus lindquistii]
MGDTQEPISMTTPRLSSPMLFTSAELKANEELAIAIRDLCNEAFSRHKSIDTEKWDIESPRFPNMDMFHAMLTPESVFAVVFDENGSSERDAKIRVKSGDSAPGSTTDAATRYRGGKVIACAAAVPWKGGWSKEGAGTETGWEIKTVCVDAHPNYLHKGLAVRLLAALERYVMERERSRLHAKGGNNKEGHVDLWILTAECQNGVYWRKRGYEKVRSKIEGKGVWSCKTSFEMTVLRKHVVFDAGC